MESAIRAAEELNTAGMTVSLDLLGESVTSPAEAKSARDDVLATLDAIAAAGIRGNVSVKLTQLGLDISSDLCVANMRAILSLSRDRGLFVRIDMEGSAYTERTLDLFHNVLHPEFADGVGVVIQSYLRRSARDVCDVIAAGARVRLCKGAYAEPPEIAFQERDEVDASYISLTEELLRHGSYPGLATHDEAIIDRVLAFVDRERVAADRFEFQMLYGIRRDLQEELVAKGYKMRIYIPFGAAWYPYLMRRLAERPANVASIVFSLVRETFTRR